MTYPVLLHLEDRRIVVVGGGQVATRKTADALDAGAHVTIISPTLTQTLKALVDGGAVDWQAEPYTPVKLRELKPFLIFAATDSQAVNAQVIADAQTLGALAGAVDDSAQSDLTSMAAVRRGRITVAVATDGASPALAAHLRRKMETVVGDEYCVLADWLAELRPLVQQQVRSADGRRALWQVILDSAVLDYLRQGDQVSARKLINRLLAEAGVEAASQ